jgi:hypothetical protein
MVIDSRGGGIGNNIYYLISICVTRTNELLNVGVAKLTSCICALNKQRQGVIEVSDFFNILEVNIGEETYYYLLEIFIMH